MMTCLPSEDKSEEKHAAKVLHGEGASRARLKEENLAWEF
jgi:hypothetical protein